MQSVGILKQPYSRLRNLLLRAYLLVLEFSAHLCSNSSCHLPSPPTFYHRAGEGGKREHPVQRVKNGFGMKGGEKIPIAGELTAMFLVSLGLLPKAVLEAAYFQDGESAKRTLQLWLWLISALCLSFLFSFLFYH